MDVFKELCPIYKSAIAEMILAYDNTTNREIKFGILSEFTNRYTLPPMYWKRLLTLAQEFCMNDKHQIWIKRAKSQFRLPYHTSKIDKHLQWDNLNDIRKQIVNFQTIENGLKMCEEAFKHPHKMLPDIYKLYNANLLKPLSKNVEQDYLKSLKLYKQFAAAKNNPQMWLSLLDKLEDKNIVVANLELYLTLNSNWAKKELWLKLIEILKETKSKHLLNVYSRYIRLFISDMTIREEYRAAIEAFGIQQIPIAEYWLDTICFEYQFIGEQSAYQLIQRILTSLFENSQIPEEFRNFQLQGNGFAKTFEFYKNLFLNIDHRHTVILQQQQQITVEKPPRKVIHFQNPCRPQQLWLHNPLIRYILKTAKAKVLRKFFQTCKFFYALQSTPICYHFLLTDSKTDAATFFLKQESIFLSENDILSNFAINNLYVSNVFTCFSNNRRILAQTISKIYRSDAEFYLIQNQDLYLDELQKLIPFQSAKSLSLENCIRFHQKLKKCHKVKHLHELFEQPNIIRYRNDTVMEHETVMALFLKKKKQR